MKTKTAIFAALAALFCMPAAAAARMQKRDADFAAECAAAAAAEAFRAQDFRAAAGLYAAIAAKGGDNAALLTNLGACRLMAGDAYGAAQAFDAAERRAGETPETARGQLAAYARTTDDPGAGEPLLRRALRWHWSLPVRKRVDAMCVFWAATWLAFAIAYVLQRAVRKTAWPAVTARALACLSFLAFLAAGASVVASLAAEQKFAASLVAETAAVKGGAE